ncbi:MAG: hypothetical protein ACFFC7_16405 [Candidatus Hermodarchaeota archaeon]
MRLLWKPVLPIIQEHVFITQANVSLYKSYSLFDIQTRQKLMQVTLVLEQELQGHR